MVALEATDTPPTAAFCNPVDVLKLAIPPKLSPVLTLRDALRTYLRLDDHHVWTASSVSEVNELLPNLEQRPAIVISDFHLGPTERGSDAIDRVRQHFQRTIPAILLTGDTSAVPARFSSAAGIRMLNKPVDAHRLVSLMDELLQPEEPQLQVSA